MSRSHWAMVRHGQTDWNLAGRLQGIADIPLNGTGRAQARAAAEELAAQGPWDLVVCSTLSRARETAQIIAEHLGAGEVMAFPTLVERDYGPAEGLSVAGLDEQAKRALMEGGESPESVVLRGIATLDWLSLRYPGRRLVLVSHGTFIRLVLGAVYHCDYPRIENGQLAPLEGRLLSLPAGTAG